MATDTIARGLALRNRKRINDLNAEIDGREYSRLREVSFTTPTFTIQKNNLNYTFSFTRGDLKNKIDELGEEYDDYEIIDIYLKSRNNGSAMGTAIKNTYEETEAIIRYPYSITGNESPEDVFQIRLEFPYYEFTEPSYDEEMGMWIIFSDTDDLGVHRDNESATYPENFFLVSIVVNLKQSR